MLFYNSTALDNLMSCSDNDPLVNGVTFVLENDKEKLGRFIDAVNSVTDKQVQDILSEARQERDRIVMAAAASAESAGQRSLEENLKMTRSKYVRETSKAELEMKKQTLKVREELTAKLFDSVVKKLEEFVKTEEYPKLLEKRLSEETDLEGACVCVSPRDMRLAGRLKKAAKGITVTADDSVKYGGFYLLRSSKGTVTDRTFDCILREQQSLFSSKNILSADESD